MICCYCGTELATGGCPNWRCTSKSTHSQSPDPLYTQKNENERLNQEITRLTAEAERLTKELAAAREETKAIIANLQVNLQPAGSPPLGNAEILAAWIIRSTVAKLSAARAELARVPVTADGVRVTECGDELFYLTFHYSNRIMVIGLPNKPENWPGITDIDSWKSCGLGSISCAAFSTRAAAQQEADKRNKGEEQ